MAEDVGIVKKVLGTNAGAIIGNIANVIGAGVTFSDARKKGDSVPISIAKSIGDFAFYEMLDGAALPYALLTGGISMAFSAGETSAQTMKQAKYLGSGRLGSGTFDMSNAGYTMRQRALNQIRNNGQQINSILGNEARTFVRSNEL